MTLTKQFKLHLENQVRLYSKLASGTIRIDEIRELAYSVHMCRKIRNALVNGFIVQEVM